MKAATTHAPQIPSFRLPEALESASRLGRAADDAQPFRKSSLFEAPSSPLLDRSATLDARLGSPRAVD